MSRRCSVCRRTGKRCIFTHNDALRRLASCTDERRKGKPYRTERRVYLCQFCDEWHLTSQGRR